MFREITVTKQADSGPKRRWYQSDYFDLFIFYIRHSERADSQADREFVGVQLCYDIRRNQRTFEWKKDGGFSHHHVRKGGDTMSDHGASASLLEQGGEFDARAVLDRFMRDSEGLPPIIRNLVMEKFTAYGRERQKAGVVAFAPAAAAPSGSQSEGPVSEPFSLD